MNKWIKIAFSFILLFTIGCNNRPAGVLSDEQMHQVLVDMHKLDGVFFQKGILYVPDANKDKYYQFVMKKHAVTKAQFDSTLVWYTRNPEKFEKVYDLVINDLRKFQAEVYRGKYHPFDTTLSHYAKVNLWKKTRHYEFTPTSRRTQLNFSVADNQLLTGDVYILMFKQKILPADSCIDPYAVLRIDYESGKSDSLVHRTYNDGKWRKFKFRLTAKNDAKIKSVSCALLASHGYKGKMNASIDSVALVRLYDVAAKDSLTKKVETANSSFFQRIFKHKMDSSSIPTPPIPPKTLK
jgi:Domain of unknown function (DUF4296)